MLAKLAAALSELHISKARSFTHFESIHRPIQTSTKMPAHPTEETAPSGLTDKIAQGSQDSNASDHPIHDENKGPVEQAFSTGRSGGPQKPDSKHTNRLTCLCSCARN